MKRYSKRFPEVSYDIWKTPISEIRYPYLALEGMLHTASEIYFFFGAYGHDNKVFVMSAMRSSPFRVVEEAHGYSTVGKYFLPKGTSTPYKEKPGRPRKESSTMKFWNTTFIQELDEGGELSGFSDPKNKNICQYLVKTCSEWIEIVLCEPVWETHRNTTTEKLIIEFVKTRYDDFPKGKYHKKPAPKVR